jgi:hypothetical protein
MTDTTTRRRGHGEDAIYFDAAKNRYVGAISLGFGPDGKRTRRKVTGRRDNWSGLKTCCYVPRGLESGDLPQEMPDIVHSDPFPPRPEASVPA